MCLSKVTTTYDNPSMLIIDAWKEINASRPRFNFSLNGSYDIPFDQWIAATDEHAKGGIRANDGKRYGPGFHAYTDDKSSRQHRGYMRVFLRGVVCVGTQDGHGVVVARQMYVPSQPNGWPPLPYRPKPKKSLFGRKP